MVAEQAQEEEAVLTIKLPVLETELSDQERDQTVPVRQDEFAEVEPGKDDIEEELKDKKVVKSVYYSGYPER